jgi:hypothetical protein
MPAVAGESGPAIDPAESVADTGTVDAVTIDDSAVDAVPPPESTAPVEANSDSSATNVSATDGGASRDVMGPAGESGASPVEQPVPASATVETDGTAPTTPDYSDPAVVVVVSGDRTLATTVETTLENRLGAAGYPVLNEQFFEGFPTGGNIAAMGRAARDNGGDVIVLVDARVTGSRKLEFYGRSEEQYVASLQVTAMLPGEQRNLGAPWQDTIEYTTLNAIQQGNDAAGPIARDLIGRLDALKASN